MKKILLTAAIVFAVLSSNQTFAQVGFGTNTPDKSSAVDIVSSKRGLLIPRVSIGDLSLASPVNAPATSLMVYNTNTTTGEGFYYWDSTKWVRFTSANTEKTVIVAEGQNVKIDTDTSVRNTTKYTVGVKGGYTNGQVLVTKVSGSTTTTEWVNASQFIQGVNGVTVSQVTNASGIVENVAKLGGALTEKTQITTTAGNTLAITGLTDVANGNIAETDRIMLLDASGVLKMTSASALLNAKDLTTDGKIVIGDNLSSEITAPNSVLVATKLSIKQGSIGTTELANDAVTSDKIADNAVGSSEIADNAVGNSELADNAVGTAEIIDGAVNSDKILDNTITTADIAKPGDNNQVMVTDSAGNVQWIDQSALANKDNYTGTSPISISAGTANANGGLDKVISVATASSTTLGVVKEAATPSVTINAAGELGVNTANITLAGDVTGPANATVIAPNAVTTGKITDDAVTASKINADVAGAGLQQNATTGALEVNKTAIGEELTTDGKIVIGENNSTVTSASDAVLVATKLSIKTGSIGSNEITDNSVAPVDIQKGNASQVMVTDTDGTVKWIDQSALGNTVTADNGLTKTANNIQLGGALLKATAIGTDATKTLALTGLVAADASNSIVVAESGTGVLATVKRAVSVTLSTSATISSATVTDYSPYVQEVNINTAAGSADVNITLPDPAAANGQVINIKLTNTAEADAYVNIIAGPTTIAYGALPYQGWVIKSNGTNWVIVARN